MTTKTSKAIRNLGPKHVKATKATPKPKKGKQVTAETVAPIATEQATPITVTMVFAVGKSAKFRAENCPVALIEVVDEARQKVKLARPVGRWLKMANVEIVDVQ